MILCVPMAFGLDSSITLSADELNENSVVAASGTDITVAMRVLQLQINASGCDRNFVTSPDQFETTQNYRFQISSSNCFIKNKSEKCDSGYTQKTLSANPNASDDHVIGGSLLIVCVQNKPNPARGSGNR